MTILLMLIYRFKDTQQYNCHRMSTLSYYHTPPCRHMHYTGVCILPKVVKDEFHSR